MDHFLASHSLLPLPPAMAVDGWGMAAQLSDHATLLLELAAPQSAAQAAEAQPGQDQQPPQQRQFVRVGGAGSGHGAAGRRTRTVRCLAGSGRSSHGPRDLGRSGSGVCSAYGGHSWSRQACASTAAAASSSNKASHAAYSRSTACGTHTGRSAFWHGRPLQPGAGATERASSSGPAVRAGALPQLSAAAADGSCGAVPYPPRRAAGAAGESRPAGLLPEVQKQECHAA